MAANPQIHVWARSIVDQAWTRVFGKKPTAAARQIVQAIGLHEGGYGLATKPAYWAGSNNWGGVQATKPNPDGTCPVNSVLGEDYDSKGDAKYAVCFRTYPTALDGAIGLVQQLKARPGVIAVIDKGSADEVAQAMYRSHYFGGFHPTRGKSGRELEAADAANIDDYAKRIFEGATRIVAATGERLAVKRTNLQAKGKPEGRREGDLFVTAFLLTPFAVLVALKAKFS